MPATPKEPQAQALSAARYAQLRQDVQRLVTRADSLSHKNRVGTLWRLGRRITRERIAQGTGYHNTVLRDLKRDTTVSLRNLQYAVTFVRAYPALPKQPLSWGHYRLLLDRPSDAERTRYESRARKERLSVHALARAIADDRRAADPDSASLKRPSAPSYLYSAKVVNVVDGDTLDLQIDLGFHTQHIGRFRLADIDCPELPTPEARAARDFVFNRLMPAQSIVVKTQRTDQHGRFVAHLFYSEAALDIDQCFFEGHYLNADLLEAGHAMKVLKP